MVLISILLIIIRWISLLIEKIKPNMEVFINKQDKVSNFISCEEREPPEPFTIFYELRLLIKLYVLL